MRKNPNFKSILKNPTQPTRSTIDHFDSPSNFATLGGPKEVEEILQTDSFLIDQIMDATLEQTSAQREGKDRFSILNLLNSYDEIISKYKLLANCLAEKGNSGVDSVQATRIYRKLLKLHRDKAKMATFGRSSNSSSQVASLKKDPQSKKGSKDRSNKGLAHRTIDTTEGAISEALADRTHHFGSKLSHGVSASLNEHSPKPNKKKGKVSLKKYSSQKEIKRVPSKQSKKPRLKDGANMLSVQTLKPPLLKPSDHRKHQRGSSEERISTMQSHSTDDLHSSASQVFSLPKLSFKDMLNKAGHTNLGHSTFDSMGGGSKPPTLPNSMPDQKQKAFASHQNFLAPSQWSISQPGAGEFEPQIMNNEGIVHTMSSPSNLVSAIRVQNPSSQDNGTFRDILQSQRINNDLIYVQNEDELNSASNNPTSNQPSRVEQSAHFHRMNSGPQETASGPEYSIKPDILHIGQEKVNRQLLPEDWSSFVINDSMDLSKNGSRAGKFPHEMSQFDNQSLDGRIILMDQHSKLQREDEKHQHHHKTQQNSILNSKRALLQGNTRQTSQGRHTSLNSQEKMDSTIRFNPIQTRNSFSIKPRETEATDGRPRTVNQMEGTSFDRILKSKAVNTQQDFSFDTLSARKGARQQIQKTEDFRHTMGFADNESQPEVPQRLNTSPAKLTIIPPPTESKRRRSQGSMRSSRASSKRSSSNYRKFVSLQPSPDHSKERKQLMQKLNTLFKVIDPKKESPFWLNPRKKSASLRRKRRPGSCSLSPGKKKTKKSMKKKKARSSSNQRRSISIGEESNNPFAHHPAQIVSINQGGADLAELSEAEKQLEEECSLLDKVQKMKLRELQQPASIPTSQFQSRQTLRVSSALVLVEQDLSRLPAAMQFRKRRTTFKVFRALQIHSEANQKTRYKLSLALNFRESRLLKRCVSRWHFYAQILVPEERTMAAADRQYSINFKAKVLNVWRIYSSRKALNTKKLRYTRTEMMHSKKQRIFNAFVDFMASQAIKKAQLLQAYQVRRKHLLWRGLQGIRAYKIVRLRNEKLNSLALSHDYSMTITRTFIALYQNRMLKAKKRELMQRAQEFFRSQVQPNLLMSVLIALQKFSVKQKTERKAYEFRVGQLLQKSLLALSAYVAKKREERAQEDEAVSIYCHKLKQMSFIILFKNVRDSKIQGLEMVRAFDSQRLSTFFAHMKFQLRINQIRKPIGHKAQLQCAQALVQRSFGSLMNEFWIDFPDQKIDRLPEVYGGRVELELSNWLEVSNRPRYAQFFIDVNRYLLDDKRQEAFQGWKRVARQRKEFKEKIRRRHLRRCFISFRQAIQGKQLVDLYILRSLELRGVQIKRQVLESFRLYISMKRKLDGKYKAVLQARNSRMLSNCLGMLLAWKFKQDRKKKQAEMASRVLRHHTTNKVLRIWRQKLHARLKKRHLNEVILPKVNKQYFVHQFFKMWFGLFAKNRFLSKQLESIEQFQANEHLTACFKALRLHADQQIDKRRKEKASTQQYLHTLVSRTWSQLQTYSLHSRDKKDFYFRLELDRQARIKARLMDFLSTYAQGKKMQRINDLILTKEVLKVKQKAKFRRWRAQFEKRQALRFMEVSLDFTRVRLAFERIFHQGHELAFKRQIIVDSRGPHLLWQCLQAWRRYRAKEQYLEQALVLFTGCKRPNIETRFFDQWRKAFHKREQGYKIFGFAVLQIKLQMQKTTFNALKARVKYRLAMREAVALALSQKMSKGFCSLLQHSQNQKRNRRATVIITEARLEKARALSFSYWRYRFIQKMQLRAQAIHLEQTKLRKVFDTLASYSTYKRQRRAEAIVAQMKLSVGKKRRSLISFASGCKKAAIDSEKMLIAEVFNNQFRFRQAFRVWAEFQRKTRQLRDTAAFIQEQRRSNEIKKHLELWQRRAGKPLKKIRFLKQLPLFQAKTSLSSAFKCWRSEALFLKSLEQKESVLQRSILQRQAILFLQKFKAFTIASREEKDLQEVAYSQYVKALQSKALRSFALYTVARREKHQLNTIAYNHQASIVLSKSMSALRFFSRQSRALARAEQVFAAGQRRKYAPYVLNRMRRFLRERRHISRQNDKAFMFYSLKQYERGVTGLFQYCVKRAGKAMQVERAVHSRNTRLFRKVFETLSENVAERQLLRQKRDMLFSVVQMTDHQNLMQTSFNCLFTNMLNEARNLGYYREQLRLPKMARIWHMLAFNRYRRLREKEISGIIIAKRNSESKANFFFKWRTQLMQAQIIQAQSSNRDLGMKQAVFEQLAAHTVRCRKGKQIQAMRQNQLLQEAFVSLQAAVQRREFKAAQGELAARHRESVLKSRSLRLLVNHANEEAFIRTSAQHRGAQKVVKMFIAWKTLQELSVKRKQALTPVLRRRCALEKRTPFSKWKKEAFFAKMCAVMYRAYGLDEENQTDNLIGIEEDAFSGWRAWVESKKRNRAILEDARILRDNEIKRKVFGSLKLRVSKRVALLRVKNVLQKHLWNAFIQARVSSEQMGLANKIGLYIANHLQAKTKKRVLAEWSALTSKDYAFRAFMAKRALRIKAECFIEIKQRLVSKLIDRKHQMAILDHFSKSAPENLHRFSKLFLLLSFKYREDEELGRIFGVENPNKFRKLYEDASSIGFTQRSAESGARVCQTVLAKYVFDKWRLSLKRMREKRKKEEIALTFLTINLKAKATQAWRERAKYKAKKREILNAGREIHNQILVKKGLRALLEYGEVRKNKSQLYAIGREFREIKEEQTKHKILVTWLNLTLEQRPMTESILEESITLS